MQIEEKIKSIRDDIDKGLKSKAMNRLQGLINAYPNELEFREELGRLYLSVNWLEKAGLHLLLIEPQNEEEQEAVEVYMKSINNSGHKALVDLKFKGDRKIIPPSALRKIEVLESKSLKETNVIPKFKHVSPNKIERSNTIRETWKSKLELYFVITLLVSIPILIIIGIIQVIKWFL